MVRPSARRAVMVSSSTETETMRGLLVAAVFIPCLLRLPNQRIDVRQIGKAAEVAVGRPKFPHTVLNTQGGDACIVNLRADDAARFDQRAQHRPM